MWLKYYFKTDYDNYKQYKTINSEHFSIATSNAVKEFSNDERFKY